MFLRIYGYLMIAVAFAVFLALARPFLLLPDMLGLELPTFGAAAVILMYFSMAKDGRGWLIVVGFASVAAAFALEWFSRKDGYDVSTLRGTSAIVFLVLGATALGTK
ncbi:MAG: hypothetical protein KBC38_02765 [Candidatus Pacebacteria bacterium]|nr:hypothetical protein [Candidatus Paceibacterota bacterium]MBP9840321.1 hypothetical protein [Candidatus Paceibacterota bacterium]